jgi:hypothetical protein
MQLAQSPVISATLKLSLEHTHCSSAFSVIPHPLVSPPISPSNPRTVGIIEACWLAVAVEMVARSGVFIPFLMEAVDMVGRAFDVIVGVGAGRGTVVSVERGLLDVVGRGWTDGRIVRWLFGSGGVDAGVSEGRIGDDNDDWGRGVVGNGDADGSGGKRLCKSPNSPEGNDVGAATMTVRCFSIRLPSRRSARFG